MIFFEKKLSLLILLFSLPLLFLPKINLFNLGDTETAGIRIDDIILCILAMIFIWAHLLLNKRMNKLESWVLLLTLFSIFSFFLNKWLVSIEVLHVHAKIFYALRFFEYFIFFYIGLIASQFFPGNGIVRAFFLWNFLLMFLQKLNLAGGMTVDGYNSDVSTRVQGIASFPSEMGLLLNLIFCYMIYDENFKSKLIHLFHPIVRYFLRQFYTYWMFCLFSVFVVFTGNRISILALFICFLFKLKKELNFKSFISIGMFLILVSVLVSGMVFIISQTDAVLKRSMDLFTTRNLTLVESVWTRIDMSKDPVGNESIALEEYDVSWWLRIHKWVYALKTYVSHPECYLQGVGPGFAWSALDGGFLRILTEYGLIGCLIFWKIFSIIYKMNHQLKWMTIAFLINMIFFDAYLAYKTMSFLLFVTGHVYGLKHQDKLLDLSYEPRKKDYVVNSFS